MNKLMATITATHKRFPQLSRLHIEMLYARLAGGIHIIELLTIMSNAKKRFVGLPMHQVKHLCYICTLICNGATWDKVIRRRNMTYLDLGIVLMAFDDMEISELMIKGEQNWDDFVEREKRDIERERSYRAYEQVNEKRFGSRQCWPVADPNCFRLDGRPLPLLDTETIAIQVNGRLRGTVEALTDALEQTVEQLAYQNDRVKAHIENRQITKKVFVMGRVLNFVVQDRIG